MSKRIDKGILRILDANLNRAKEGARVCEEVCRFILNDRPLTATFKAIRHRLTGVGASFKPEELLRMRRSTSDVGTSLSEKKELERNGYRDIFFANIQRLKESVRVLEECLKTCHTSEALHCKQLRYEIYELEKRVIKKFCSVRNL